MGSDELIIDAETQGVPEWAWKLSEAIVLGDQGCGNAAVLIYCAFTSQLAEARESERELRELMLASGGEGKSELAQYLEASIRRHLT